MKDGHTQIETMRCDLQQVERERSDVRDQLCEANMQKEQLEKQVGKNHCFYFSNKVLYKFICSI